MDGDGLIDKFDLDSFLSGSKSSASKMRQTNNFLSCSSSNLNESQVSQVISNIRRALQDKKLSHFDAFAILDSNLDGFFTLNELNNLDKLLSLTSEEKKGYFAYLDSQDSGMVDYQRFLEVIN